MDQVLFLGGNGYLHSIRGNHTSYIAEFEGVEGQDYYVYTDFENFASNYQSTEIPEYLKQKYLSLIG